MKFFKQNFFIWFLIFGVISVFGIVLQWDAINDPKFILFSLFSLIVAPLIMSFITTPKNNVKAKLLTDEKTAIDLSKLGFKRIKINHFKGLYKTYLIEIKFDYSLEAFISYNAHCQTYGLDIEQIKRELKNKDSNLEVVSTDILMKKRKIRKFNPYIEKIKLDLDTFIKELSKEGFPPNRNS